MASDVKWIKIATDIFDDEKILMIESLPSADSIIVIWSNLLTLAGKQNNHGVFVMNDRIAYTDEMLSTIFRRDLNLIRMALKIFVKYGMIEIINDTITIPNWSKHQNLDKIEKRNAYQKKYMQTYREKQKLLACKPNKDTNSKTNVSETEEEREEEQEKEVDKEQETKVEVVDVTKQMVLLFEKCTGRMIKPIQLDTLISYLDDIDFHLIEYILEYSCSKKDPYQYAKKVLESCVSNGIHTVHEFELSNNEHKGQQQTSSVSDKLRKHNEGMYQHDWDFDDLERKEEEHLKKELEGRNGRDQ